jgi:hypothetical protein
MEDVTRLRQIPVNLLSTQYEPPWTIAMTATAVKTGPN